MESFIQRLSQPLQNELKDAGRLKTYSTHELVFEEHAFPAFFPIILKGKVKIVKYLNDGKETIINIFGPNDVMLIPPLIDNRPFPATGITLEPTEILKIEREKFLAFLNHEPEFAMGIITELCGLLREKNTVIRELATQSPEHRIIVNLLRLTQKLSKPGGGPVTIPVKRRDIADMCGLTTETTIRVIRQLSNQGYIAIDKGKIIIDAPEKLRQRLKEI